MARPTPVLEIAFVDPPLTANASATWEDLSTRLVGQLSITRGRLNELQDMPAGRMTLTLKNSDRQLDPENASSVYYPNVYPMRKIRFGLDYGGTTYWRFCGFIEAWQTRELSPAESVVDVRCVDATKYFNQLNIVSVGSSIPQEPSGDRISRVLDAASWPAGDRLVATGDIDVMEVNDLSDTALGHMQLVARAELGALYISRTGNVAFADRSTYLTLTSAATFNNDAAGNDIRYSTFLVSYDDSMIYNQIRAWKEQGQAEHIAEDATSQGEYFTRTLTYRDLPLVSGGDVDTYADLLLHRYKDARLRPASLTADPAIGDTWADVLALDLTDRITVLQETFMNGDVITYDAHIESISEQINVNLGGYSMTMGLSAHIPGTPATVAVVGDAQWIAPAALSGTWTEVLSSGGQTFPAVGYWKDSEGRVYLRGVVSGGSAATAIFTLPSDFRPPAYQHFLASASGGAADILVTLSGTVAHNTGPTTLVDLSSIRFLNH